jgi:hypothetical protein
VVIENDGIEAEALGFGQGLNARGPAIDRDEDVGALLLQRPDGVDIRAVTLRDTVGDVDGIVQPAGAKILGEERCAAGPIDVIIPEDRYLLVAHHRIAQPGGRSLHIGEPVRIRHEIPQARVQEALGVMDPDATSGQDTGQHVRQAMGLGDGERDRPLGGIAALDPGAPQGGLGDAQEGPGQE